MQETITSLKQQLAQSLEMKDSSTRVKSEYLFEETSITESTPSRDISAELLPHANLVSTVYCLFNCIFLNAHSPRAPTVL